MDFFMTWILGIVQGIIANLIDLSNLRRNKKPCSGQITEPAPQSLVCRKIECNGTANNIPKDHSLVIAVEINGDIWPKRTILNYNKNRWSAVIFEHGTTAGQIALSLFLVTEQTRVSIDSWLAEGERIGHYKPWKGIPNSVRLDETIVILDLENDKRDFTVKT